MLPVLSTNAKSFFKIKNADIINAGQKAKFFSKKT